MVARFELNAEPRAVKGKGASRRLRHAGRVPAILYGAGKQPAMITLDHNEMLRHLASESFHTSILTVKVEGESDQAILRAWEMHPHRPQLLHVDLQRISASEKIHMRIPLHFTGGDVAPGVKQEGGVVAHLMNEVDVTCLPKDLPEFLTVDLSHLHIGHSVHLSDIKLPGGAQITSLAHGGGNLAVAAITTIKVVEEAPAVVAEAAPAEGEAAPAEGEKKAAEGEAKKAGEPAKKAAEPAKKPEQKKEGK